VTLNVSGLTGGYGDVQVLWGIDVSVDRHHVTAVLGRNGAGKTSLLNAIAGLLPTVSRGSVTLDGRDISGLPPYDRVRAGLAFVQEGKRIFRRRTVEENLLLGGYATKRPFHRALRDLRAPLELAYARFPMLAARRKTPSGGLSGGQQQMLAIAQALMPGPQVLLLDEPSAGLAPAIAAEVFALVDRLKGEGLAILLVEQTVEQALAVADHVAVLETGRVVADGPVGTFDDAAMVRDLYLGRQGDAGRT
jgi:branched-chain amino acid transport system ATP-binding protein